MLSSAILSLGVAGSALAWPSLGHSSHSSIARALQTRQETSAPAAKPKEPVAATWFASWHANDFPLANVSWNKYTTVSYSFAVTTPNISFVNISDPEVFKDFVSTAHTNNVSATISVGGWTGSLYFSSAVATADNRTEFVKTMVSLLKDNNLDGLSFDWEYPNAEGIGCNTKSPNDTENFLLFLKELRSSLPANATLSAATSINPFISADDSPSTNVSEFATVFDYLQIMNYDVWGPWSDTSGPNAPLNDTCAVNATQKIGSAVSAVEAWTKAGFPVDQLVLGVGAYGHGFSVAPADALNNTILNPYSPFNKSFTPPGDAWSDTAANGTLDVCGNPQVEGGSYTFWGLIEGGFLNENGTANTAEGITYKYGECSQTPFVYNQTSGVLVGFDNAASFTAKGQFINTTGLRGFAMWETGGDYDDILLDAIRSGAGFPEVIEDGDDCEDDETGATTPETGNSSNTPDNTSSNSNSNSSSSSSNTSSTNTNGSTSNNSNTSSSSSSSSSNNSGGNGSGSSSNSSGDDDQTNTTPENGATAPENGNSGDDDETGNSSNNSGDDQTSTTTPQTGATTPQTGSSNNSGDDDETGNSSNNSGDDQTSTTPQTGATTPQTGSSNNSGDGQTSTTPENGNSSSNSGDDQTGNSSNDPSTSQGNTSGSTSSSSSSTSSSSNTSNTSSSNNSGSNNSGSNNTGSSSTTPSCNDDDKDCDEDSEPTTTTSPQPTTPATSDDDDECEDDEEPEPAITSTAPTTSSAAPTPTTPTGLPDEGDDECEDDEPVTETTSGTASAASTGTAEATSTESLVTSASASSTSAPVMETASSVEPTAGKSYEPSLTSATVEPTTSVYSSSSVELTASNTATSAEPTSTVESSSAVPTTSSAAPAYGPPPTSTLLTTTSESHSTVSAPMPTF
ncbi:glycoside hydrolase family 18 protein [Rhizoctonia solani AG-3 Rhs1AP]|uniref:Glycoside hydrolase family 18 protein n=1 Tax=Rhizoctonia solani AG-3 Rhs1AP TaxID=1086054 RepID=X8IWM6_9AGAM|nr:glycoside hydrolase family 18 protein [Rhizoctonia solani AG-3 Rhs1AP]